MPPQIAISFRALFPFAFFTFALSSATAIAPPMAQANVIDALPGFYPPAVRQSLTWTDRIYDPSHHLILFEEEPGQPRHYPRESLWYATGLLMRAGAGDVERALTILDTVLKMQYLRAGHVEYGSFPDMEEAPLPPDHPVMWKDYDPNWRQFIGTNLIVLLEDFPARLPGPLVLRIREALKQAVEGERREARLVPTYTNIALMHAFLLDWTGQTLGHPQWETEGKALATEIHRGFKRLNAFPEYNSPTYYGVDLFALALWRTRARSPYLRSTGTELEADLWRDTARYYQPELKNLAGPFTRAYGMDLTRYANLIGLLLVGELGPDLAPFPKPGEPIDHALDYPWEPLFALVRTRVPVDALAKFRHSEAGERLVKTQLPSPSQLPLFATAWLSPDLLIGAETTSKQLEAGGQFHPATVHWSLPAGGVGWVKLVASGKLDATASPRELDIRAEKGDLTLVIHGNGSLPNITQTLWTLPGLEAQVDTDGQALVTTSDVDGMRVTYPQATRLTLKLRKLTEPGAAIR